MVNTDGEDVLTYADLIRALTMTVYLQRVAVRTAIRKIKRESAADGDRRRGRHRRSARAGPSV